MWSGCHCNVRPERILKGLAEGADTRLRPWAGWSAEKKKEEEEKKKEEEEGVQKGEEKEKEDA